MKERLKLWAQKPLPIILLTSVLVFYSNWPVVYGFKHSLFAKGDPLDYVSEALGALVLMFFIPVLVIKYVFNKPLSDFGLRKPREMREAAMLSVAAVVVSLPVLILFSKHTAIQDYYAVKQGFGLFFLLTVGLGIFYYLSEEFIFRGFLFFGLWDRFQYHTFWISNLIFVFFHIGKPVEEVLWAFFFGLIFSFITYRTRSVWPAVLIHLTVAFILNVLVNFA